jgi:pimeloyl-ACP methyl ester carboxylesterase
LEYEVRGNGEPVVLIHGSFIADGLRPLLAEPSLTERCQLFLYHRRGFAGSTHLDAPISIAQQAADCRAFLEQMGIQRAHFVGHSYSGNIALQLALDAPDVVHSIALLEPALFAVPSAPQLMESFAPAFQMYEAGDKTGAVDGCLRVVFGPEYRDMLDRVLPGAFAQAARSSRAGAGLVAPE